MGLLKTFRWPFRAEGGAEEVEVVQSVQAWSLDRSINRIEGERHLKARNYPEAEKYLALAVSEADARGHSVPKRVRLRLQLAEAQRRQAQSGDDEFDCTKLADAEATIRTAIEHAARVSDRTGYVLCLDALAEVFADQNNYPAVEKVMQDAIVIESQLPHPDPVRMARRTHRLGIAHHKNGRSEDAIPALEKALAMHEEVYGENHIETARLAGEVGAVHRAQGTHDQAQAHLRRALRLYENECGADSPQAIRVLHHLAGSLEEAGDIDGAAAQYERALLLKQRVIGGNMDDLAEMQFGIAGLYITWGNYSRARELLTEAIGTFRRKGGPRLAVSHETLGHVEECSGRYHDAVREFARGAKVWEGCGPARAAELAENLKHRAEILDMLRKKNEASWLREKASQLIATVSHAS